MQEKKTVVALCALGRESKSKTESENKNKKRTRGKQKLLDFKKSIQSLPFGKGHNICPHLKQMKGNQPGWATVKFTTSNPNGVNDALNHPMGIAQSEVGLKIIEKLSNFLDSPLLNFSVSKSDSIPGSDDSLNSDSNLKARQGTSSPLLAHSILPGPRMGQTKTLYCIGSTPAIEQLRDCQGPTLQGINFPADGPRPLHLILL
ncbi:hypothetical protein DSO57_1019941 [Entomophthora muscae]|uniref:Uncharacterized protein n=1 Tax=Entomophthora muscae TaxID=34485 RepID=A0ACC2S5V7_9FUNG|nr:hypothetical protein DSO57_1019941 [Entomophthora muscae]